MYASATVTSDTNIKPLSLQILYHSLARASEPPSNARKSSSALCALQGAISCKAATSIGTPPFHEQAVSAPHWQRNFSYKRDPNRQSCNLYEYPAHGQG